MVATMWIQLYGESINLDNVTRFWLDQDRSSDDSIIPTLKIQLAGHGISEWLEFEIHAEEDAKMSSIELAKAKIRELEDIIKPHILL